MRRRWRQRARQQSSVKIACGEHEVHVYARASACGAMARQPAARARDASLLARLCCW